MRRAMTAAITLLACLALAGSARAQDEEPSYDPASEAHRPGRWSMQFQVDDDFQLESFTGVGLALTRNSSPSSAWRMGFTLNGNATGGDLSTHTSTGSGTFESTEDLPDDERFGIRLDLLRMRRFQPDKRIGLELGAGPRISFDHAKTTQEVSLGDIGFATQEQQFSTQQYGVVGRLGVEVFLARALSVHAHYAAFLGYRHTNQSLDSEETYYDGTARTVRTDFTLNQWSLANLGVTLGLSAYL